MDHRNWDQDQDRRRQPILRDESPSAGGIPHNWSDSRADNWSVERMRVERPRSPYPRLGPRRPSKLFLALLVTLLVIVGAVGVYKSNWFSPARTATSARPTATPGPIQPLLTIDASASEACPTGVAWSPDALKIAVAADGEQSSCDTADPGRTQVVTLYDARSGKQLQRISVHETLARLNILGDNTFAGQPSWSPDGSLIALPFELLDTTGQHSELLVIPVGSGAPRVLLDTADTHLVRPIWNLKTGALVATQTKALPQALTYTWSADGGIHPGQAAPQASATAYTGSPVARIGSTSFSRWQSGALTPVSREGYVGAPFAWFHYDTGALWSPDGQYVAPDYSIMTRLPEPAGAAPAQLQPQDSACIELASVASGAASDISLATTYCGQGALPYPDAAYAAVVAKARAGFQSQDASGNAVTSWSPVEVAWRPDGKVLATMLPADDFPARPASVRVTLYDTATGNVLTTLSHTVSLPSSQTNAPNYLGWSPTGLQLALINNGDSQVFVWGASSLAGLPPE